MYEAPKITEAGRLGTTTLGSKLDHQNDDGSWFWPTSDPQQPTTGSR